MGVKKKKLKKKKQVISFIQPSGEPSPVLACDNWAFQVCPCITQ